MKVLFVGNGAWGKAVASLVVQNTDNVSFWSEKNPQHDFDVVILTVPTQAIRFLSEKLVLPEDVTIVNCAKGIERDSHMLPFQIVQDVYGQRDYFSLMGPSFAQEVEKEMPTLVNLGYEKKEHVEKIKRLFETDFFRVRPSKGVAALELAAAFKNIYAIACGIADGIGYETNTRVKLMLLAMEEFESLCEKLHFDYERSALPAIVGDLILTCSSTQSRNFTFGKLLVKYPAEEALARVGATVEGYYTTASVSYFVDNYRVKLPLAQFVATIVREQRTQQIKSSFTDFVKHV